MSPDWLTHIKGDFTDSVLSEPFSMTSNKNHYNNLTEQQRRTVILYPPWVDM